MRVLEIGLKALAADVSLTFDLQQWHNIIEEIESKIRDERKTLPRGAPRNSVFSFCRRPQLNFSISKTDGAITFPTIGRIMTSIRR